MLESLRGLGYSAGTAIADIVDNSISAGARTVRVEFTWADVDSRIAILDDGRGMSDAELESAMRLGDRDPLQERGLTDLGRFGMGLKTASLSQCRRLTVASSRGGNCSCLRWDLDALAADPDGGWLLYEGPAPGSEVHVDAVRGMAHGTMVLWERLDRLVTTSFTSDDFLNLIDDVEAHLAMVFHRMLEPDGDVTIMLNGRQLKPWDPFMDGHPAKIWESPVQGRSTEGGRVSLQCHVLPHRDKLSQSEFDFWGGPMGWTAQQGFYIYRNKRLLVAGGWLGLGTGRAWNREEFHRLARVRLDIPNTADAMWKIDIRKSIARPPVALRPWLTGLAEDARQRARKVFAFRGEPSAAQRGGAPVEPAWRVERLRSGLRYRIDRKHPGVASALEALGNKDAEMVLAMLRIIEETVPVQRIWLDTAEGKDVPSTGFDGEPSEEVTRVLQTMFDDMVRRRKLSVDAARRLLLSTEPFHKFPQLVSSLQPGSQLEGSA